MTLNPVCDNVETKQGVPLTVTGVAQVKIMKNPELLGIAAEQFLGKSEGDITDTILQTLEGHLRAILGTLTVEEVYKDRDQFANLVREIAAPDVGRMGIEILSFTIKDVYDNVDYLASLGKTQTAVVKRDAEIGVAQANRDAGIREAECEKSAMDIKYSTDTKIEDNSRGFKMQKANFDTEVNTAKAAGGFVADHEHLGGLPRRRFAGLVRAGWQATARVPRQGPDHRPLERIRVRDILHAGGRPEGNQQVARPRVRQPDFAGAIRQAQGLRGRVRGRGGPGPRAPLLPGPR